MMSSVIPARLEFQCGHAALVTLPRLKGETSAQRTERVAREKRAALTRQCDFCGPASVSVDTLAQEMNGSYATVDDVLAAEPVAVAEPVAAEEPLAIADAIVEAVSIAEPVGAPEPVVTEAPVLAQQANGAHPELVARRRAQQTKGAATKPVSTGRQFVVEYRLETIVRGATIRDALREATALGATRILAIAREE
jgi:hypothetical protein